MEALPHRRMGLRDLLPCAVQMKQRFTGIDHRTARHAHCAGGPARDVRPGKRRPFRNKAVQIRRHDFLVSQRMDGVEPLVVR